MILPVSECRVHMLESALSRNLSASLIDVEYYSRQAGKQLETALDAYNHFRASGQKLGLNPSPFFYTSWYLWQNPDACRSATALDHFVSNAVYRLIDTAPFIDTYSFIAGRPHVTMIQSLINLTNGTDQSLSPNLQDHLDVLHRNQRAVHQAIKLAYIRRSPTTRRRLVWVQAGANFSTTKWFEPNAQRSWDLLCNWYSPDGIDLRYGEIHLRQFGTKSTGIHAVLSNDPELLLRYDQVLFLDDDLTVVHADLDELFKIAEETNLKLFQASLTHGSFCVWPDLFRVSRSVLRYTTGVEIMMPGFSRDALFDCAELFGRSVSGFGLDVAFSERVRRNGHACGVIDAVSIGHNSKIDERNGTYYRLMRDLGINPKLELYSVVYEQNKFPNFGAL